MPTTTPRRCTLPVDPRWIERPAAPLEGVSVVWQTLPADDPDFNRAAIVVQWADGRRTQFPCGAPLKSSTSELVKRIRGKSIADHVFGPTEPEEVKASVLPFVPADKVFTDLPPLPVKPKRKKSEDKFRKWDEDAKTWLMSRPAR